MPLVAWNESFSVGVKAMDDQHKGLVKALNDLHAAMLEGQLKPVSGSLLNTLMDYTRQHFAAEEALMRRTAYPELGTHSALHKDLTREVEKFVGRYERGETGANIELLTFLRDWLLTHIQKVDRSYRAWMNAQGVR